ncbi:MAG TPA: carboxypeptidase regulatory-like domain-containing protein [Bryobacteraceae bacterium]|nr:carboxypeptidase regulatory-like domain-containing protein [Bryobacteraceae bacterium]
MNKRNYLARGVSSRLYSELGVISLGLLLSLVATPVWAQSSTAGTVAGQVTDESSAAVPGAAVKLTDTGTGATQNTISNEAGRYIFSQVNPGTYRITFTKEGFTTYEVNSQPVDVGMSLTLNAKLKVGATSTTVEVTAATGAELQTMNATVGNTLSGQALMLLPNMGRDVTTLAVLQPATTLGGFTAGSYNDANTYTLDGGNITDDMAGNTIGYQTNYSGLAGSQGGGSPSGVIPTPVESIEEFKVSVSNQTSDFNNSSGAQIQMVTKRGTNQFHGSGYWWYFDTKVGAANSWSNNHTPFSFGSVSLPYTPIISNHRNRFGGTIGGPLTPKDFLGKKWYFFFNYEGLRFPNQNLYSKNVPSPLFRAGVIQVQNAAGQYVAYNLNSSPVTVGGVTYQPAVCPAGLCDPRGVGLNPVVSQIWNQQMPLPNNPLGGDTFNTQGFLGTIRSPLTSNIYVGRIDHDFSDKWHFYATYRDFKLVSLTTNQVDIGGVLPGTSFGTPTPTAPRPQQPSVWTTGLTTLINPTTTNTFVFGYTRTFWQWGSDNGPAQLPGLGGALEIGGESASALIPYNVNTQSVRQRFWDGQDKQLKDDLTMIKGNHLFGFGGSYLRAFDYHSRTDNGSGVNNQISYLNSSSGINWASSVTANGITNPYIPATVPSSQYSSYETLYSEALGLVSSTQVMYTRAGPNLTLQPLGTSATDKSVIPTYATYFYDTWHARPSLTLTYGIGWNLELPPYELNGNQVALVDQNNQPIVTQDFIAQREMAALQGQAYTPTIAYTLVRNVGAGLKYPYNPFYGEFSPRASLAWSPKFSDGILGKVFGSGKTVVRGGYGRIYGRLNGVDLVLVPLLGPGLLQGVTCQNPSMTGACAGSGVVDPTNAFRIGTDGLKAPLAAASQTLGQPFYPGVGSNPETVDPDALDPHFRPDRTDNFTLTIQREINQHNMLEIGYIGKIIRNEYMLVNLDAVPYMTTLGGQSFAQAYGALYQQLVFNSVNPANVTAQPFFESSLGGANSAYCQGFGSCTAALASKNTTLIKETAVSDLWAAMNKAPSWTLGRTMLSQALPGGSVGQATSVGMNTSLGYGNYNAIFVSLRTNNWHGLTAISNFTFGRSLGTSQLAQYNSASTPLSIYDLQASYGPQNFDIKFLYNLSMYYQPPWYRNQRGVLGHILGGWTFSPLFTAQSGSGTGVGYSEGSGNGTQAFGEVSTGSGTGSTSEAATGFSKYTGTTSVKYNIYGDTGTNVWQGTQSVGTKTSGTYGLNMFSDPGQVYGEFRPCVLGFDTSCGGYYSLRGLPTWNLDLAVVKDIGVYKERVGTTLFFQFTNVLNHFQPSGPSLSLTSPTTFGQITGQANTPRNMEFGLRIRF